MNAHRIEEFRAYSSNFIRSITSDFLCFDITQIRLEPSLHVQLYPSFKLLLNVIPKTRKQGIMCKQAFKTVFRVTAHEKDVYTIK